MWLLLLPSFPSVSEIVSKSVQIYGIFHSISIVKLDMLCSSPHVTSYFHHLETVVHFKSDLVSLLCQISSDLKSAAIEFASLRLEGPSTRLKLSWSNIQLNWNLWLSDIQVCDSLHFLPLRYFAPLLPVLLTYKYEGWRSYHVAIVW